MDEVPQKDGCSPNCQSSQELARVRRLLEAERQGRKEDRRARIARVLKELQEAGEAIPRRADRVPTSGWETQPGVAVQPPPRRPRREPERQQLLTVDQTAERLALHPRTVRRMLASRELRAVYPTAGSVRVRNDDLEKLIKERTT